MNPDTPHFTRHGSYDTFASYRAHTPDPILALAAPTTRSERMAAYSQYIPDARRIRSFFLRLPLATRGFLLVIILLYFVHFFYPFLTIWGALIPDLISIKSCMMRSSSFLYGLILICTAYSIPPKHIPPHPQIHLPPPPKLDHPDPTPRTLRIRTRYNNDFHPLHRTLWPDTRTGVHILRALRLPFEYRRSRIFNLGLPPSSKRKHKTLPPKSRIHHLWLRDTNLDNANLRHPSCMVPRTWNFTTRTSLRSRCRVSLGNWMDKISSTT